MERLFTVFPNVEIVMRNLLSMMITNASGERSFSKLKWVKTELRNHITQSRLNILSFLSIEYEILTVVFEDKINDFENLKFRK